MSEALRWTIQLPQEVVRHAILRLEDSDNIIHAIVRCPKVGSTSNDCRAFYSVLRRSMVPTKDTYEAISEVERLLQVGRCDRTWEPVALWLETPPEEPRVYHLSDLKDKLLAIAWVPDEHEDRAVFMTHQGDHGSSLTFERARNSVATILGLDPQRVEFEGSSGFDGGRYARCPECGRFGDDDAGHQPTCSRKPYSEVVYQALNGIDPRESWGVSNG